MGSLRFQTKRIIDRISRALHALSDRMKPQSVQEMRTRPWRAAKGDTTLRLEYNLDPSSVVLDVGGYEGEWAGDITARYGCVVHVFEPVVEFSENIQKVYGKNPSIRVYPVGLAGRARIEHITIDHNRSSVFNGQGLVTPVRLIDIADFIREHNLQRIDLLKINIEGGEYELLERLIETGNVNRVQNIQLQFHDFVPNAETRMQSIQTTLKRTHELTYQFPFVWENWRRMPAQG